MYVPMPKSCSFRASMPMRTWTSYPHASHAQIRTEKPRERRVMLPVEGDLAAAIRGARRRRRACGRAPPQVDDFNRRGKEDPTAPRADGRTEVHVLHVHEVALVDEACRFGVRAADEQARAADPAGPLLPVCHGFHPAQGSGVVAIEAMHQPLLAPFRKRRNHPPERELR